MGYQSMDPLEIAYSKGVFQFRFLQSLAAEEAFDADRTPRVHQMLPLHPAAVVVPPVV